MLCKLCQDNEELKNSHVLPSFVGKYLKETSATGFLTAIDADGKPSRSQDLFKTELLCGNCELLLSGFETFFANTVFHPIKNGALATIPVDERLARFAVSISLRALWVMQMAHHPLAEKWNSELRTLEFEWRSYLMNSPGFSKGRNSHHIVFCDEELLAIGVKGSSPNLIHSVMRTAAYYLFEKLGKAYVFANMAGVQVISMVSPFNLPLSRGTQVYPEQTLGVDLPAGMGWGGYYQNLVELEREFDAATSRLTARQTKRIDKAMNTERAEKSEDVRILRLQRAIRGKRQP